MFVTPCPVGQSIVIDEILVYTLTNISPEAIAFACSKFGEPHEIGLTLTAGERQSIAEGVTAMYIPHQTDRAYIGFETVAGARVRCSHSMLGSVSLTSSQISPHV